MKWKSKFLIPLLYAILGASAQDLPLSLKVVNKDGSILFRVEKGEFFAGTNSDSFKTLKMETLQRAVPGWDRKARSDVFLNDAAGLRAYNGGRICLALGF